MAAFYTTTQQTKPWHRLDGVDLLRGLSIVLVLMNHIHLRFLFAKVHEMQALPAPLVAALVWNGQAAVQIFFTISGFLITSTSIRRWGSPDRLSAGEFYLLRFARIAPLLLLLLAVLSGLHLAHVANFVVSAKTGGLSRALLAALTFHVGFLEATRGYLPGNWDILWSLSVEETFYLFFPLLACMLRKRVLLVALLLLFAVAGPFARVPAFNPNEVWREYSYLGGMDAIALGCLTAMLLSARRLSRRATHACCGAGMVLLLFVLGFPSLVAQARLGSTGLTFTVLAIGTCLLIAAASQSQWQAPAWLAPLRILGQRSYEVYLTHMFVVFTLFGVFLRAGKPGRASGLLYAGIFVLAGLLGWLVAVVYAEPMNRWIRERAGVGRSSVGLAAARLD